MPQLNEDNRPAQQIPALAPTLTGDSGSLNLTLIRATVRRALQERTRPPRNSEVHEITATLRGHLQRMLREAQRRTDGIERGTEAWIRWTALIMRAEDDLYRVSEPGTQAAATRMNDLGRTCRRLADCLDE